MTKSKRHASISQNILFFVNPSNFDFFILIFDLGGKKWGNVEEIAIMFFSFA